MRSQLGAMSAFNDNSFERSLKCDFPARESFREALLADLLAMNGQEQQASSADHAGKPRREAKVVKLGEAELEMLAAAEGEERIIKDPSEE
ncbi:MAG: hypothetical protein Q4A93_04520 [Actinomycetota bacterium]|nr:hypothetical protein [Actinomycetota bacterium]